jgi:phosphatidyl-myo-inositol alpha-mannosyltransferase
MRIALVSPYDWSVDGGVNRHVTQLAARFRSWGHEAEIFAPASRPHDVGDSCTPLGKPRPVPASGSVARITFDWKSPEVKRRLADGRFDIVHIHEPLMPLLPYHFLRHSKAANVGTFHAAKEGGNRVYEYTRPLTRRWFRKLDGKIAVSPAANELVGRYFPGYFNIIPNGIEFEHFAAPRETLPEFDDDCFNILFVGRPEKRKGLKYLLRAFIQLQQQEPRIRLIVAGAGDFSRYESLMRPFPNVVFRAHVPYDELPRYHASADVYCTPATGNESQGIALLEAMAAAVPVIASNIEGFAGVVTDNVDGLLVRPKDHDTLAKAIRRLMADAPLRRRLAEHGQAQAERYGWDGVARRVMAYYERILYERNCPEPSGNGAG